MWSYFDRSQVGLKKIAEFFKKSSDEERYLIVHNIGAGQVMEDVLFSYKIIGHYRYQPNLN